MADNKSGAVLTWLAGIAATVIAGVLLNHFTQPPSPPPVTQVGLNGIVEDAATQKPVVNAIVTANLGPKLASQPTDSEGRYAFIMDSTTPPARSIDVDVLAGGYQRYAATVPLTSADTFAGVPLQPVPAPVAAPPPGQPAAPPQLLPKSALILHIPNNYAMRADVTRIKAK